MKTIYNVWVLIRLFFAYMAFLIFPPTSIPGFWGEQQMLYFEFGEGPHSAREWFNIALLFMLLIVFLMVFYS